MKAPSGNMKLEQQAEKHAVELWEETVHLLRSLPLEYWGTYYLGSLPFFLGLLYFWIDMTQNALANRHLSTAALGMACLFLWMKSWQAVFANQLYRHICNEPSQPWTLHRLSTLVFTQTLVQPSGLFVKPLSAIFMIPYGWVAAFYQNITVLTARPLKNNRSSIVTSAWKEAKRWPLQNHWALSVLFVLRLVMLINIGVASVVIPEWGAMLMGWEDLFSTSFWYLEDPIFWLMVLGFTYLCSDPFVKALYVLRCHYGESLETGEDLKVDLQRMAHHLGKTAVFCLTILTFVSGFGDTLHAQKASNPTVLQETLTPQGTAVSKEALNQALQTVLQEPEYAWKLRFLENEEEPGPLRSFLNMIRDGINTVFEWIGDGIEWLSEAIDSLTPEGRPLSSTWVDELAHSPGLILALIGLVFVILGIVMWRIFQQRRLQTVTETAQGESALPDLTEEHIAADALPEEEWRTIASKLMAEGKFRLALRALYLASLAYLGRQNLIVIQLFKSNRDYLREVQRRQHAFPEMQNPFLQNIRLFEQSWYGEYDVTPEILESFTQNQERIKTSVEN